MSASLKAKTEKKGEIAYIELRGQIDEDADYSGANFSQARQLVFNFEHVPLVNSTGLQKWIAFLKTVPANLKIIFEKCSPKIVKQIDMFEGFSAGKKVTILSFFAPYYCAKCDKPQQILLKSKDVRGRKEAPEQKCATCQTTMEFDALEKKYFLFLERSEVE